MTEITVIPPDEEAQDAIRYFKFEITPDNANSLSPGLALVKAYLEEKNAKEKCQHAIAYPACDHCKTTHEMVNPSCCERSDAEAESNRKSMNHNAEQYFLIEKHCDALRGRVDELEALMLKDGIINKKEIVIITKEVAAAIDAVLDTYQKLPDSGLMDIEDLNPLLSSVGDLQEMWKKKV